MTNRDKRKILETGLRAVKRDGPFFRRAVASRHPGIIQETPENLFDVLAIVTAGEQLARDYQILQAEVLRYLDSYTSRGYHAEGIALARLRKAAER